MIPDILVMFNIFGRNSKNSSHFNMVENVVEAAEVQKSLTVDDEYNVGAIRMLCSVDATPDMWVDYVESFVGEDFVNINTNVVFCMLASAYTGDMVESFAGLLWRKFFIYRKQAPPYDPSGFTKFLDEERMFVMLAPGVIANRNSSSDMVGRYYENVNINFLSSMKAAEFLLNVAAHPNMPLTVLESFCYQTNRFYSNPQIVETLVLNTSVPYSFITSSVFLNKIVSHADDVFSHIMLREEFSPVLVKEIIYGDYPHVLKTAAAGSVYASDEDKIFVTMTC